ncbi:phospholipase D family protein [Palleronia pontilimi]|nr:phospholipase D family protein [Palleronia pontilimi]
MARAAEESLDLQYYIWETDTTGWLLLDEVRRAAERGVRVRLLLDDNGIPGLDAELAALDAMQNIEVRLFNPFVLRHPKPLNYLFDFFRLNRRMHNKSMTVDGAVTILGGRNIGDVYFDQGTGPHHFDFDVLVAGPTVAQVAENFDRYWDSPSAYPAGLILPQPEPGPTTSRIVEAAVREAETLRGSAYLAAIAASEIVDRLRSDTPDLHWTTLDFLTDDPAKGIGRATQDQLMVERLPEIFEGATQSVDLVSAYFIPRERGVRILSDLAARGVRVRVLTNGLASNNVASVHSAYMGYRRQLLSAGVELLELRPDPSVAPGSRAFSMLAGSPASLHAKTFAIDGAQAFIGSFNFDPRSAALNSEMGVLIDSPKLASRITAALDAPELTYSLELTRDEKIVWRATDADGSVHEFQTEPMTTFHARALVWLGSWLPIEWIL